MAIQKLFLGASVLSLLAMSDVASADESLWVYAKGSDTRPAGSLEIKLSSISRLGKGSENGDYAFHDIRPSVEYGITDRLTVGGSLMIFKHNYSITNPDLNPMFESQNDTGEFKDTQIGGYEFEFKYNILSPYKDALGLSLGAAWDHRDIYRLDGAEISQNALEITAYLQKNFLDNTLTFAFTPKIEFERRISGEGQDFVLENELALDIAAGVSYRVAPNWFVGVEWRHQSDYLSPQVIDPVTGGLVYEDPTLKPTTLDFPFKFGTQHQNGNYFGPTVHYAQERWWATAGLLFQFSGGGSPHSFNSDGKNWDEHENIHLGLTFGYEFE